VPELPEIESYRRLAEARALKRPIVQVNAPDGWYLKHGLTAGGAAAALVGRRLMAARRRGKLLLLDTDGGPVVGLRFGMTGRLLVDGLAGVDQLLYSPDASGSAALAEARTAWDRFALAFEDGGALVMRDPRRLGGVELEPNEDRLGPDALTVTPSGLAAALAGSGAPLKARLMDQARLAGVGNLIADEVLWRSSLSPERPAGSLDRTEVARLHRHLRTTLRDLTTGGGSHTGRLMPVRGPGGRCPRDGAPLSRATVGGRTTWWCARHQR
jgi:formamidopyrimidine-DNA glycosylase